jgi:hypothetical protein
LVDYHLKLEKEHVDRAINGHEIILRKYQGFEAAFYITFNAEYIPEIMYQYTNAHPGIDVFITVDLRRGTISFDTTCDDIDTAALFAIPLGGEGSPRSSSAPLPHYPPISEDFVDLLIRRILMIY